MIDTAFSWAFS